MHSASTSPWISNQSGASSGATETFHTHPLQVSGLPPYPSNDAFASGPVGLDVNASSRSADQYFRDASASWFCGNLRDITNSSVRSSSGPPEPSSLAALPTASSDRTIKTPTPVSANPTASSIAGAASANPPPTSSAASNPTIPADSEKPSHEDEPRHYTTLTTSFSAALTSSSSVKPETCSSAYSSFYSGSTGEAVSISEQWPSLVPNAAEQGAGHYLHHHHHHYPAFSHSPTTNRDTLSSSNYRQHHVPSPGPLINLQADSLDFPPSGVDSMPTYPYTRSAAGHFHSDLQGASSNRLCTSPLSSSGLFQC
uniref:GATA-type domain-containing protein n=1 Tax=Mesocestoides corti TaxID=53468 RepID=A0A5K3FBS0_MESCO